MRALLWVLCFASVSAFAEDYYWRLQKLSATRLLD